MGSIISEILRLWSWSYSWECSEFYVELKNVITLPEKIFGFEDTGIETCCGNFSQIQQEYMWWVVDVLKSGPKISDPTKIHDTQLNLFDINEKLA